MRWTEEQLAAHRRQSVAAKPKKSKFQNIRCTSHDGIKFHSKLERDYYEQLNLRWKAGDVLWFTRQVPFWLEGGVKIILDFMVVTEKGVEFVDTKGFLTAAAKNKLKQLKARYGIEVTLARSV